MPKELLLGIDIGTTSTKAVLFNVHGDPLAQAAHEYPTAYPQPDWAEQDPASWWDAVCRTVPQLFSNQPFAQADVAAIGISAQAPTLVPVDHSGELLHPALIWMDRRSEPQCNQLRLQTGQQAIAEINGGRIDPFFLAPKLLWYRNQRPDLYRKTAAVLQANGYVVYRLTGQLCMDRSHCPLTLFFDSRNDHWSGELLGRMGLDASMLPPVHTCTDVVGEVTAEAAAATGLAAGTPVIAGMADGTAAAVEAGVVRAGAAVEMTGQSTVLLICSSQPYLADALFPLGHAMSDLHLVVGALVASGGSLRWFRDQLGESERRLAQQRGVNPFELLSELASASPPGANGLLFLPYMFGERSPIWDTQARGVFFGLSLATAKRDLVRAILEGAAFGLRHNIETAAQGGFPVDRLTCVGGGARSQLWNQIKADVLQRPIHVPATAFGAPLGDAIAAAVAAGLYRDMETAIQGMTAPGNVYEPDARKAAQYDALYALYLELYPALRDSFARLAEVREQSVGDH